MNVYAKAALAVLCAAGAFCALFIAGGMMQHASSATETRLTATPGPEASQVKTVYVDRGLGFWDYMLLDSIFSGSSHCHKCDSDDAEDDNFFAFIVALILLIIFVFFVLPIVANIVYAYPEYAFAVFVSCALLYVIQQHYSERNYQQGDNATTEEVSQ